MSKHTFRRKKLILNPFQNRLLLVYLVHFSAVTLITVGAFLAVIMARLDSTTLSFAQRQEVTELVNTLTLQVWPAFLIIFVTLIVHSIFVTHRVAGPIYKLRETLKRIGDGDLSQYVKLRRSDYLREEADVVNAMTESLRRRFSAVKDEQSALEGALTEMGRAIEGGSIGEMRRMHAVMEGRVGCLRRELESFILKTAEGEAKRQSEHEEQTQPEEACEPVA